MKKTPDLIFERYRDRKGEFRWRCIAANGKIISDSGGDGYKNRRDLQHAIDLLRAGASSARITNKVGYYAR